MGRRRSWVRGLEFDNHFRVFILLQESITRSVYLTHDCALGL